MFRTLLRAGGFARAVYKNQRRLDDRPRFLTYTVTFGCNARCIMCDSWKMPTEGDLTVDEVSRIFDDLPTMDAVRLTGGEPFVRKDFPELYRLAEEKLKPLLIHITTNGFLTDRIVKFCEQRPKKIPLEVLISLDGVGEKHNHIRGSNIAYKAALKTLTILAGRRKELNIKLAVNQTIVDADGIEQYRQLREVLRPLGVRHQMVMAYDVSATYNIEKNVDVAPTQFGEFSTFGEFTDDNVRELIGEVEKDMKSLPFVERLAKKYYLRGIKNRLLGEGGVPNPKCVALNAHLRLFPNGDIPTCQFNSKVAGNLKEQSFKEIWESARFRQQRDWVRACPGCWAECEVLPSAIYTLDLLKESILPGRPSRAKGVQSVEGFASPELVAPEDAVPNAPALIDLDIEPEQEPKPEPVEQGAG
ncbi:radical SAM protein [Stratiformator vulcanicus]|uniref:Cyclic pyranopterin monophosphate synthase n=1 Tax=Stratiformator vulcanicus TaxID=2527980 RepID=A0A517R683_9PLAN|nr:radical SAM protein [Stratiformator vulcanicus]QDT39362.1 Cyclic pyranopterin monophosphate synthase [Stratiformator vulcanicus]